MNLNGVRVGLFIRKKSPVPISRKGINLDKMAEEWSGDVEYADLLNPFTACRRQLRKHSLPILCEVHKATNIILIV